MLPTLERKTEAPLVQSVGVPLIPLSSVEVGDVIEFGSGFREVIEPVRSSEAGFTVRIMTPNEITYHLSLPHDRDVMVCLISRFAA